MKILILDNYDSFVYNLVHIIRELGYGEHMDIYRNDKISLEDVAKYDKILLSPGPGIPSEAGIMPDLLQQYGATKSILGVCLGHQAIGEAYGSSLHNLSDVLHGIPKEINVTDASNQLFAGVDKSFDGGRYHSWVINKDDVGADLVITASDNEGEVMAVRHKEYDVRGVQFHPESVLTEGGIQIIKNWLEN